MRHIVFEDHFILRRATEGADFFSKINRAPEQEINKLVLQQDIAQLALARNAQCLEAQEILRQSLTQEIATLEAELHSINTDEAITCYEQAIASSPMARPLTTPRNIALGGVSVGSVILLLLFLRSRPTAFEQLLARAAQAGPDSAVAARIAAQTIAVNPTAFSAFHTRSRLTNVASGASGVLTAVSGIVTTLCSVQSARQYQHDFLYDGVLGKACQATVREWCENGHFEGRYFDPDSGGYRITYVADSFSAAKASIHIQIEKRQYAGNPERIAAIRADLGIDEVGVVLPIGKKHQFVEIEAAIQQLQAEKIQLENALHNLGARPHGVAPLHLPATELLEAEWSAKHVRLQVLLEEIAADRAVCVAIEARYDNPRSTFWALYREMIASRVDQAADAPPALSDFLKHYREFIRMQIQAAFQLLREETIRQESLEPPPFITISGLSVMHSPRDGYSLYHAILKACPRLIMDHFALCELVRDYACAKISQLAARAGRDPAAWLDDLRVPGAWTSDLEKYILSDVLQIHIVVHHIDGSIHESLCAEAGAPTAHLRYNRMHYDGLIAELSLVANGKYGPSVYTAVAENRSGSAIKAAYQKAKTKPGAVGEGEIWFGKYAGGTATLRDSAAGRPPESRARIRTALDAVHEFIGYGLYRAFSGDRFGLVRYGVAKMRLAHLPISNSYNAWNELVPYALAERNPGRNPRDYVNTAGLHSLSKKVPRYQDLQELEQCIIPDGILSFQDCLDRGRLPEKMRWDGQEYSVLAIMRVLAVARAIGDIDVLGGSGKNAGFKRIENEAGKTIGIEIQKIDPGFSFSFKDPSNVFHPDGPRMGGDLRNIQFGAGQTGVLIRWVLLSDVQKNEFLETLDEVVERFQDETFLDYMIRRDGAFQVAGEGVWTGGKIEELKADIRENIRRLASDEVYGVELRNYRAAHLDRDPNPCRFFVPMPRVPRADVDMMDRDLRRLRW